MDRRCRASNRVGGFPSRNQAATKPTAPLIDRVELFNRDELFSWVSSAGVPVVATGDFHSLPHLATWKTLVPCARGERAVVEYLRSPLPAYLTRLETQTPARLAA